MTTHTRFRRIGPPAFVTKFAALIAADSKLAMREMAKLGETCALTADVSEAHLQELEGTCT